MYIRWMKLLIAKEQLWEDSHGREELCWFFSWHLF